MTMAMRDLSNRRSRESYDEAIVFSDAAIQQHLEDLAAGVKNPSYDGQYAFQGFLYAFERLQCMYSRGDALAELKAYFTYVVELQEWAYGFEVQCYPEEIMRTRKLFRLNFNMYVTALWLLAFALCLESDDAVLARLLRVLGNEGEDALFDRLAAQRMPQRRIGADLAYPRLTSPLYEALDAPQGKRDKLLGEYVTQWYGKMKRARWHDAHLRHNGESYYGYWCYEAAGVAKAFGFDDRALLDLPHYPNDLARGN